MTAKSIAEATFCTNCGAAYHPGCIKRCRINQDGSIRECCGQVNQMLNQSHLLNQTTLHDSFIDSEPYNDDSDLSNKPLSKILGTKIDNISKHLDIFDKRITSNSNEIINLKNSIFQLSQKICTPPKPKSTEVISTILSEQEERSKRQRNIIVYNLPELNQVTT